MPPLTILHLLIRYCMFNYAILLIFRTMQDKISIDSVRRDMCTWLKQVVLTFLFSTSIFEC